MHPPLAELLDNMKPGLAAGAAFVPIGQDPAADQGLAFENRFQGVYQDLRGPRAAAGLALRATRRGAGPGGQALCRTVDDLLLALNPRVDRASLWGSSALVPIDRIELRPLLQQVWGELRSLADSRSIKARFGPQGNADSLAAICGSEICLRRVFVECLESARRSGRPGATLDIEHVQRGPRALIVFRDRSVFAPHSATAVELPGAARGAKPAATRWSARDPVNLKRCQRIVSLHGGLWREEVADGMYNVLIDLPTGAPHRSKAQNQVDTARALH